MRYEIIYGNEAEIEAELERIKFELSQLGKLGLTDEEEDAERARLRAERDRVASAEVIEDRVELVETDDTYLGLWERLGVPERGPWLAELGFRVAASKERVTVSQGPVSASVRLSEPERMATVRDTDAGVPGQVRVRVRHRHLQQQVRPTEEVRQPRARTGGLPSSPGCPRRLGVACTDLDCL